MDNKGIRLYGTRAIILMLRNHLPPIESLKRWTGHGAKTILISPEKHLIKKLKQKPEMLELLDASHRIHLKEFRKKGSLASYFELAMILMKSRTRQTIFIADDPALLKTADQKLFGMILGVAYEQDKKQYFDSGADYVMESMDELEMAESQAQQIGFEQSIPHYFGTGIDYNWKAQAKKPVFFFDYDGTLTPIVKDPAGALLDEDMRGLLADLGDQFKVALISGRDMNDLKNFVKLDNCIYAGSHGFRISGPDGLHLEHDKARSMLEDLDRIESELKSELEDSIEGLEIERKYFAIAIHYRNVPSHMIENIRNKVDQTIDENPAFRKGKGKKLLEIKPGLDWHKGKAVEWILSEMEMDDPSKYIPFYLGDDLTDEDAFRTIADHGFGILVGDHGYPSAASYRLNDVAQVKNFIHQIVHSAAV